MAANYVSTNGPRGHNRLRLRRKKKKEYEALTSHATIDKFACLWWTPRSSVGRGRGRLAAAANSFKIHCHLGVGWKERWGLACPTPTPLTQLISVELLLLAIKLL